MAGPVCRNAAVYWPGIEKSRAEGRRLLKEAGAESLSFQLLNRKVDQPLPGQADFLVPGMRTPDRGEIATVRSKLGPCGTCRRSRV